MIIVRCDGQEWREESVEQLEERLDGLHEAAERPTSVELELGGGQVVDLVVGSERSTVQIMPKAPEPPYLVSVGDRPDDRTVFVFYVNGHWTEALVRNTLPIETARGVVRELVGTGEAPSSLDWEEV